ncbi:MAG: D-tyrosyl-tRNA(Tyr) deacylase [Spirochaetes bacterium]|jgi:D-tyrosyl-tRNA(Tyr) deacylase|nr:D-tyrosyl-tRNA(Tyr) deacylase [Spirochaetota bacterium]
MRAVVQRVVDCSIEVDGEIVGAIGRGALIYLGIKPDDGPREITQVAGKVANLRIVDDEDGVMNRSLLDTGGAACVVSQFTLYGDTRKGRRPSYNRAAPPELATPVYERFVEELRTMGLEVATGVFRAHMQVRYTNDGPVTILIDSEKAF